jgi:hypothetical protein
MMDRHQPGSVIASIRLRLSLSKKPMTPTETHARA